MTQSSMFDFITFRLVLQGLEPLKGIDRRSQGQILIPNIISDIGCLRNAKKEE